jgi:hypothetical protein
MRSSSVDSECLLGDIKRLEREIRDCISRGDGESIDGNGRDATRKTTRYGTLVAEASQFLPPYDVQSLLATQRELSQAVQKLEAKNSRPGSFTFRSRKARVIQKEEPRGVGESTEDLANELTEDLANELTEDLANELTEDLANELTRESAAGYCDRVGATCGHGQGPTPVYMPTSEAVKSIDASLVAGGRSIVVESESDTEVRIRNVDPLQQVRIRDCNGVTFLIFFTGDAGMDDNDKIVVEDSTRLKFGFYLEAGEEPVPRRTVRDFGWLKATPSPNVEFI